MLPDVVEYYGHYLVLPGRRHASARAALCQDTLCMMHNGVVSGNYSPVREHLDGARAEPELL